jgi:hypothetical protein
MAGSWSPCSLNEAILAVMEQEVLMAGRATSRWRVEHNAAMPAPLEKEVVVLKSHTDTAIILPEEHVGILQAATPSHPMDNFTIIVGFVALCE